MQVSSSIPTRKGKAGQILEYATSAAATMQNLAQVSGVPFLQTAVSASLLVLNEIQMTKMNQGMLLPIAELIHQLLSTIIHLCVANEGVLPLKLLGNIGHFAQTLQNFQNSLKLQQEETELQAIADEFKVG